MSATETIQTQYGETEIQVYDCDSCGNRVAYDETVEFTLGDRQGRACEVCADEGPVSFPPSVDILLQPAEDPLFCIVVWPLMFIFGTLDLAFGSAADTISEMATGILGTLLWVVGPLLLLLHFGIL